MWMPLIAMHLDRLPDHPIGQWLRQQHNVLSVDSVFSALSTMKIAAIAAPGDRPGPFSAMAVRPRPLANSVLKKRSRRPHRAVACACQAARKSRRHNQGGSQSSGSINKLRYKR